MRLHLFTMLACFVLSPTLSLGGKDAHSTKEVPWPVRKDFVTVVFKDRLWVMGGANYDDTDVVGPRPKIKYFNDVWCTSNGLDWTLVTQEAPWTAREGLSAVVFKNRIWIMGGTNTRGDEGRMNDVLSTTDGKNWECVTQHAPWPPLYNVDCTVFKDRLFLLEHRIGHLPDESETIWFSDDGKVWQKAPTPAWHAYSKVCTAVLKGTLYLMVPYFDDHENSYNSIWRSTDGICWQQILKPAPFARADTTMTEFNGRLYILGGMLGGTSYYANDSWVSKDGVTWMQNNSKCSWKPRGSHGAVVFHDHLWILGGWGEDECLNDVYGSADGREWQLPKYVR